MCVALRVYTRALIVRNMGKEDWTMIMAAVGTERLLEHLLLTASDSDLYFLNSVIGHGQQIRPGIQR